MDHKPKFKSQSYKTSRENIIEHLSHLELETKNIQLRTNVPYWHHQIKICCSSKDSVKKMKRQTTDWMMRFVKQVSDKGLIYKNT